MKSQCAWYLGISLLRAAFCLYWSRYSVQWGRERWDEHVQQVEFHCSCMQRCDDPKPLVAPVPLLCSWVSGLCVHMTQLALRKPPQSLRLASNSVLEPVHRDSLVMWNWASCLFLFSWLLICSPGPENTGRCIPMQHKPGLYIYLNIVVRKGSAIFKSVSVQRLNVSIHVFFHSQTGNVLINFSWCYFCVQMITMLF